LRLEKIIEKLRVARQSGNSKELTRLYREACKDEACQPQIWLEAGLHFMSVHQMDYALDLFKKAERRLGGTSPDPNKCLGMWCLNMQRPDQAIHEFKAALAITPSDIESQSNLAFAHQSAGNLDQAEIQYESIGNAKLLDSRTRYNLAQLRMMQKRFSEASVIFNELRGSQEIEASAVEINLIACLLEMGDLENARIELVRHWNSRLKGYAPLEIERNP
jgi:tetratricopeptide (TPR) repeat protein